jgi:nucleotide-binding universal stress UspA family protein
MVSLKRILCPVDFSSGSRAALQLAAAIAAPQRAAITALHVMPLSEAAFAAEADSTAATLGAPVAAERARARRDLADFIAPVAARGATVDTCIVEAPAVHVEILAQADRLDADLIVIGTHGRSGFDRLLLGSVTEKVLRTARQPVMTVGPAATPGSAHAAFRHIVCGTDFSDCSLAALRHAVTLARDAAARVTVVHAIEWAPVGYDPLGGPTDLEGFRVAAEQTAREHLQKVVEGAGADDVDIEQAVRTGRAHHVILETAAAQDADLIVLGIHGANPVVRMLFGSTATHVVRRASCPVLTVRAGTSAVSTETSAAEWALRRHLDIGFRATLA